MNAQEAAQAVTNALNANPEIIAEVEAEQNQEAVNLFETLKNAIELQETSKQDAFAKFRGVVSRFGNFGELSIAVEGSADHFVPSQGFETLDKFTQRLYVLVSNSEKDFRAIEDRKAEAAKREALNAAITQAKGRILKSVGKPAENASAVMLSGVDVDTFINITNYENNRDVEDRARKQAKAGGNHQTGDQVAIVMLDKERNKALWERTQRIADANGVPSTLPFIKADGHTRAYGWSIITPKSDSGYLFSRPESLFVKVYLNQTDEQIFDLVREYCNGVSKANNSELQQMGMKRVEFNPTSDFVAKDSWKTAFRTIDTELGKDIAKTIQDYQDELDAIDCLKLESKKIATHKKLSGVRAAMIITFKTTNRGKWKEFWSKFFNERSKNDAIINLSASLLENTTRPAKETMKMCVDLFNEQVK